MGMKGRTILHRTLHGAESNGACEMRIILGMVILKNGERSFFWALDNDAVSEYRYRPISMNAYALTMNRLIRQYRFQTPPVRTIKNSCLVSQVLETRFYI